MTLGSADDDARVGPSSQRKAKSHAPRVLLLWPGGLFEAQASFGVPQMLGLASALRKRCGAEVDVIDLDMERALTGRRGLDRLSVCSGRYDVVGISCYSSYDYLKVMAIGEHVRGLQPDACFVTGGYHPSARPRELVGEDSPFDYVIVGDGETPLCRLVSALAAGKRPLSRQLGPEALHDPSELLPTDWSLLSRYRPIARQAASQVEIYLSRGCPYDCSFCMERAKRETSWRAIEPDEAVEELHRADRELDLRGWTLRVPDPLFGMKNEWRKRFLEGLAARPIRAEKVWLVLRVDLIDRADMALMARANVACGFGLESGDPEQLRRIRKSGKLSGFLDKMMSISEWARELNVPFGANIIVGHPGETAESMRTSARYMERLFLGPRGTHGFLAVDPFRLYPGSPIDEHLAEWKEQTGMRVHRYPWWYDGDQEFLSEWIDPSDALDYEAAERLRYELFAPIVAQIPERFAYQGRARDYMMSAPLREARSMAPEARAHMQRLHQLWRELSSAEQPSQHVPATVA